MVKLFTENFMQIECSSRLEMRTFQVHGSLGHVTQTQNAEPVQLVWILRIALELHYYFSNRPQNFICEVFFFSSQFSAQRLNATPCLFLHLETP